MLVLRLASSRKRHPSSWAQIVLRSVTNSTQADSACGSGLPVEQRCKNLLAGNWRGQLTVVDHLSPLDGGEPRVTSELATYASPRGFLPPAIILTEGADSDKIEGIRQNKTVSLTIGRIDPSALVATLRAAGMQLPCLSLLGDASPMTEGELGYTLRRAQKVYSRISGFPTDWEARLGNPKTRGYYLSIQSARYVDMSGSQLGVSHDEIDRAFLDPLAPGQIRLLSSFNSDQEQLHALRMFCAAYMSCNVAQALMTQADRWGFTILARPLHQTGEGPFDAADGAWREFRIAFNREMQDVNAFVSMLHAMRQEAESLLVETDP